MTLEGLPLRFRRFKVTLWSTGKRVIYIFESKQTENDGILCLYGGTGTKAKPLTII